MGGYRLASCSDERVRVHTPQPTARQPLPHLKERIAARGWQTALILADSETSWRTLLKVIAESLEPSGGYSDAARTDGGIL